MAYVPLVTGDIDAKSPVSDDVMALIKSNSDWLYDMLSDGASAPEDIVARKLTLAGSATALTVNNSGLISGDLSVLGLLSTSVFFSSEQLLNLYY